MEYEKKQQKDTGYHLRKQKEHTERGLVGYQPSEKERREKKVPGELFRAESQAGTLSAGLSGEDQEKLVMTVSQERKAGAGFEEKNWKREGAKARKSEDRRLWTNSHNRKMSAALVEVEVSQDKSRMLQDIAELIEEKGNQTASEILPFLKEEEQREAIRSLEEEARDKSRDRELASQNRRLAETLREDLRKREEQKQRLLQMLELSQEQKMPKKAAPSWNLFWDAGETEDSQPEDASSEEEAGEEGTDSQKQQPEAPAETPPKEIQSIFSV